MSFPRQINPLVIEDNPLVKDQYDSIFQSLSKKYPIAAPHLAFCYQDAMKHLAKPWPYHLVILDLRLPEEPGQPESEMLDFGQTILDHCLRRDDYPVPALLVISGNLQQAASQAVLESSVRNGFHYGRVLVKSQTNLGGEIEAAVQSVLRYLDAGIHVTDGGSRSYPTISPREEDLLRRCICAEEDASGLDLTWWSATSTPWGGWTKTLVGRFFLRKGCTQSLHHFFKLATSDGAANVSRDARIAGLTHKHVKVVGSLQSHTRSLLVTQSAGKTASLPTSLNDVFSLPPARVVPSLPAMAAAVADQIEAFGSSTPDLHPVGRLLWKGHVRDRILTQWRRRGGDAALALLKDNGANPVDLFDRLVASKAAIRYVRQDARHGDLNFSNVAVEETAENQFSAWVFDVASAEAGANVRDLATLEITALLHQSPCDAGPLPEQCRDLYAEPLTTDREYTPGPRGNRGSITHRFIAELRAQALRRATPEVYAALLFDEALMQLGGLDFGSSHNKIHHPPDSAYLAALTARLLVRTASRLVTEP
jgi:CheY-like chemotaxis protein